MLLHNDKKALLALYLIYNMVLHKRHTHCYVIMQLFYLIKVISRCYIIHIYTYIYLARLHILLIL